ncbi:molybdenum ABC transporter ATP-binding protein [Parvularcula marina]|nr:molybdenum ABC transporter ATP-binding protein [Parvularcula marina]
MPTDHLEIDIEHGFGDFQLSIAQSIPLDGITAIFGPSGSGKTTLLRLITGFLRPDRGRLAHGADVLCDTVSGAFVPAHRRSIGYMFQDGRLFPHLSVERNLLYADRRSGSTQTAFSKADIIDAFELSPLLPRLPISLSGGERQRVALARTLLSRPRLLLLDEPLSALDRGRRADILSLIGDLPGRFCMPVLYVSHDVGEVIQLASNTIILSAGRVKASGPTVPVLNEHGVAKGDSGIEPGVILTGTVTSHDEAYHLIRIAIGDGVISLPTANAMATGTDIRLRIEARNVAISRHKPEQISIRNILPAIFKGATVEDNQPLALIEMEIDGQCLRAQVTREALDELALTAGERVFALVKTASLEV